MMGNEGAKLNQIFYHGDSGDSSIMSHQLDETTIRNIIDALNNPVVYGMLSEEEKTLLAETVKTHVVNKALLINQIQKDRMPSETRSM